MIQASTLMFQKKITLMFLFYIKNHDVEEMELLKQIKLTQPDMVVLLKKDKKKWNKIIRYETDRFILNYVSLEYHSSLDNQMNCEIYVPCN